MMHIRNYFTFSFFSLWYEIFMIMS